MSILTCPIFIYMKNLTKIFFLFVVLIGSNGAFSQEILLKEVEVLNKINTAYKLTATVSEKNSVIVTQIGSQNWNQNTITANPSTIQIYQNGQFNATDIYRMENEVNEFIIQNGDYNSINEMAIGSYNSTNNYLIQNGDNNRITSFGSNSISEDLKIKINGNNTSVLIINR